MQAYKVRKGTRFRYSNAYLDRNGMLRAWIAGDLNEAAMYRTHGFGLMHAARRVMSAQKWRFELQANRKRAA